MRREKKSSPGMLSLLASGTRGNPARLVISTLSRFTSHPVVGRLGGEVPFDASDLVYPGNSQLNRLCQVSCIRLIVHENTRILVDG